MCAMMLRYVTEQGETSLVHTHVSENLAANYMTWKGGLSSSNPTCLKEIVIYNIQKANIKLPLKTKISVQ